MSWFCEENKRSKDWWNDMFRPIETALNSMPDLVPIREKRNEVRRIKRQIGSNIDRIYPCWK